MPQQQLSPEEFGLYITTTVLSGISVACSLYLWVSIKMLLSQDIRIANQKFVLLSVHVFWMAFSDMGFALTFFAFYLPMLVKNDQNFWDNPGTAEYHICTGLAVAAQFFQMLAFSWYAMICWVLWRVLNGAEYFDIGESVCAQKTFVFIVSTLTVGLALISKYAGWFDVESFPSDIGYVGCWSSITRYFFYSALFIYMTLALFLFIYSWTKLYKIAGEVTPTMCRILLYVFVFWMVWIWPALERISEMVSGSAPVWLIYAHQIFMAMSGTANFAVWRFSRLFEMAEQFKRSYNSQSMLSQRFQTDNQSAKNSRPLANVNTLLLGTESV